jgi:ATP-binding cassette subfamily B protein
MNPAANPQRPSRRAAALAWRLARGVPGPLAANLALTGANALCLGLYSLALARLVDALVSGRGALAATGLFTSVVVLELLTNTFSEPARAWLDAEVTLAAQRAVLDRAARVPLARFLDASFHDHLARATRDLDRRLVGGVQAALAVAYAVVRLGGLLGAVLLLGGGPLLAAASVAGGVPLVWSRRRLAALEADRAARTARPRRLAARWHELLTTRGPAAEVRLFAAADWLRRRWAEAWAEVARTDRRAAAERLGWNGVAEVGNAAAFAAVLALAVASVAGHRGAVGLFAGLLLAAENVQGAMAALAYEAGTLHEHATLLGDLGALLEEPPAPEPAGSVEGPSAAPEVTVEGVAFRYPRQAGEALSSVSLRLAPGEVVALVGPNGAGKSTLAALLLGLHAPDRGRVRVGGAPPTPGLASAVFQDFVRYRLTVRDNVGFGDLRRLRDDAALGGALERAGSDLGGTLDVWLAPEFGGRDLSGGEWLRVAIARGTLPPAGLVVLDEPTAALDPLAEVDLVRRLLALGRGRTAVVVSHRLGVARLADRVLVLDGGRLVEEGSHAELLARGGLYARLWQAQASWYAQAADAGGGPSTATDA